MNKKDRTVVVVLTGLFFVPLALVFLLEGLARL